MTPRKVAEAIEFAYESLKKYAPSWRNRASNGINEAALWQSVLVSNRMVDAIADGGGIRLIIKAGPDGWHTDPNSFYDDEKGKQLIARAKDGDFTAEFVLRSRAADFIESGSALPEQLGAYIVQVLRAEPDVPPKKRGRSPYANHPRNFDVAVTIRNIMRLGFRPTRNPAAKGESACSIVTQALTKLGVHLSEDAVEKIWERFAAELRD